MSKSDKPTVSVKAAEMVLKYVDDNRTARASYPDADLPVEAAMRLLARKELGLLACPACKYDCPLDKWETGGMDDNTGAVVICPNCCAGVDASTGEEVTIGSDPEPPGQKSLFDETSREGSETR